ncbi:MAG TPA: HAMP domain-containing sensor histidine kinase [Gemmatimonadaceae bacterium]
MSIALRFENEPPTVTLKASHRKASRATPTEHHAIVQRLSHELRTPLNSVIGFSRVLKENRTGNQRPADLLMLEAIRTNGERLLGLVEDLVAISITREVCDVPIPPYMNVAAIAEELVGKWRETAERKRLEITLKVESYDLIRVDPMKLAKLLDKLICNAVKFTTRGSVVVTVARRNGETAPGSLVVEDSGIGIYPDQLATIFEPFTQVDGSTSRHYEGVGLGLPIVRALAESMGCSLEVESEPGKGTRFEVSFPK